MKYEKLPMGRYGHPDDILFSGLKNVVKGLKVPIIGPLIVLVTLKIEVNILID